MADTGLAPVYRYYTADLLTNEILAEIPFRSVSYERAVKGAGGFSGSIPVIEATESMDLYESTMPGNTALYVVRNGVCVWGGIIWSRSYDVVGRVLQVSGSEFTSYFYHRRFWKTWGHSYGATLTVTNGGITAQLDNGSASSALRGGASVKLQFDEDVNTRYDGFYTISLSPTPTFSTFDIDNSQAIATVNVISRTNNIVTAITDVAHRLSVNDTIELDFGSGTGSQFDGTHVVLSVGGSEGTVFTFALSGAETPETDVLGSVSRPIPDGTYPLTTVSVRADTYDFVRSMIDSVFADFIGIDFPNIYIEPGISYNYEIIEKQVEDGIATLKTAEPHDLAEGQAVQVKNVDPMFDGEFYVTETRAADEFSYELGGFMAPTPVVVNIKDIERVSATDGVVLVTTLEPHGFLVEQSVIIETETYEGGVGPMLNGTYDISEVPAPNKFKYNSGYPTTIPEIIYDPATASSETRRNLVFNPNFTVNTSGWAAVGSTPATIARDTDEFFVGTASLEVVCDGAVTLQGARVPTKISVDVSTFYVYSVYVKGEANKVAQIDFAEYDVSNSLITTTTNGGTPMTGEWQRLSIIKETSSTTDSVEISIKNVNNVSHTFYVDAVMFEKGTTTLDYFDGDTTDTYEYTYSWSATASNSESIQIHNIDIISAKIDDNTVTLTATEPPDFTNGASVVVSGVYPQISIAEKSFDAISSLATITTASDHYLEVGDTVDISGLRDYSSITARKVTGTEVVMTTNLSHNIFIGDTVNITDMKDVYRLTTKKLDANVATLTTSVAHNISDGDEITVTNIYDTYPVVGKILTENVATLTLTVPVGGAHNFKVNDSVSIAGIIDTATVISKTTENGVAVLTTDFPHNFLENDDIVVTGMGAPFDGAFKVLSFTDTRVTYSVEAELVDEIPLTAANGTITSERGTFNGEYILSNVTTNTISFNRLANNVLSSPVVGGIAAGESILNGTYTVTDIPAVNKFSYDLTAANIVEAPIISVSEEQGFEPTATVDSIHLGDRLVTSVTRNTFTFTQSGIDNSVAAQNVTGTANVDSIFNGTGLEITARTDDTFSYELEAPNNILETPANSLAYVVAPAIYNGTFTLTAVNPDLNSLEYAKSHIDMPATSIQGYGKATVDPVAIVSTFGPYPGNADIGIGFSTKAYSGKNVEPVTYRGFELVNVGEALSRYSDTVDGFEYRIDCAYDAETNQFIKTFILIPIDYPDPTPEVRPSPISRFGADKLVFEYPGNIINLGIEESAENSATRFFAVGENDLGPDAGPPFSVDSAKGLLRGKASKRKWALLDEDEKVDDVDDENVLYTYAARYLSESRPPDAKLSLSVNGSLQPIVGSYAPGDWCSLIVDDEFVRERLRSRLEPRDDIILRKIEVIKVSVPDGTTFPEKVDLTLVPEWKVDSRD
jgi:hypothetical protein